jgi:hypothetical protein
MLLEMSGVTHREKRREGRDRGLGPGFGVVFFFSIWNTINLISFLKGKC